MPAKLLVFLKDYLEVETVYTSLGGGFYFEMIENFETKFHEAVSKFNKETDCTITRQHSRAWFPVSLTEAVNDFATPELEGSFYMYLIDGEVELDCNLNATYCDYCQ